MKLIDLDSPDFRDKVLGCWMGKNCGGTLGAPLEKTYGEPDPFDVWWYPELREGGIPNDDLEMQLIWLKALEEVGPDLKAADLAQYWLDYIGYNWDEYGLSKTNMRLGLLPPVCSSYNNWFKHSMGCPIRSEIWACVAPGAPRVAVKYAYEDAICDHAGGESVYGEMFNTAIEAAAFVVTDNDTLLDIGRSYVPDGSETAKAIDAARQAFRDGIDWKQARQRVLDATPNYNAQYSPINMAFQVIGLLYGTDFGDAICKAVNCGYDTDCTGATLGSWLGIVAGAKGLPAKWTEPLGDVIATNESWGGLRNASTCANPVSTNLDDLTTRTIVQAKRAVAASEGGQATSVADLYADDAVRALWTMPAGVVSHRGVAVDVLVDYLDSPTVDPANAKKIVTTIVNRGAAVLNGAVSLQLPKGWTSEPSNASLSVAGLGSAIVEWEITAPAARLIENSNRLTLIVSLAERSAEPDVPIILIGAKQIRVAGPYPLEGISDLETTFPPETLGSDPIAAGARPGSWTTLYSHENELPLADRFAAKGVYYVQAFLHSNGERSVRIGVPTTGAAKFWLNNVPAKVTAQPLPMRPNYGGNEESYLFTTLTDGWNELLVKCVRTDDNVPFEAHLMLSDGSRVLAGLVDVTWTRFPWDA